MGSPLWSRWLLFLAGLGAMAGCAQLPGGSAYTPVQLDSRLAAERYLSGSDPDAVAQTHALDAGWTKMGNGTPTAYTPAVVTASREEPVIRTSSLQMSELQQPARPSANAPGATTARSLYDKQPWEVELDSIVRGICRGC